ncbi:uncharacterized protein LOC133473810 isoform X5 [Phyllopteryx taeniolatus]|uniref:uncharacterized protein LOC133473810 isoform X5 n=1 Tax=Phyllopteryx taeniolatus TaxID=161469 RepID=UPI002AD2F534|nr:uncharacterized protein LOC133473810 isoform X5 [Phyllopteryx taeniolatus]
MCLPRLLWMSLPAYKKTQETLSQAGQKTSAAFTTMSSAISRKLGDMRMMTWLQARSSQCFISGPQWLPADMFFVASTCTLVGAFLQ